MSECHSMHVEIRRQLVGIYSFLLCGSRDETRFFTMVTSVNPLIHRMVLFSFFDFLFYFVVVGTVWGLQKNLGSAQSLYVSLPSSL